MQQLIKTFDYEGRSIQFEIIDGQVMANANLMCQAFSKEVRMWTRLESTQRYLAALSKRAENAQLKFIQTREGKNGGTWIHEKLILKLAEWLDVEFEIWCDEKIAELLRTGTVSIKPRKSRQQKYVEQGKDPKWISDRIESVSTRNSFTFTLKSHGVRDEGYRNCTNAIYNPLFGGTTEVVREKKGLEKKANIRDNLSRLELTSINLIEQMATAEIESKGAQGNAQCELICTKISKVVASAISQVKN